MSEAVVVALITGVLAFAGTALGAWMSNRKSTSLIIYRLDRLEEKTDKHNKVIERTFELEKDRDLIKQRLTALETK